MNNYSAQRLKSLQVLYSYRTHISAIFRVQMKTASTEGNVHEILEGCSDNSQDRSVDIWNT